MATIGFIGLGHMGNPMAKNLAKKKHTVIGYDLNPKNLHDLQAAGGLAVNSIDELAKQSDIIILVLPTVHSVENICQGEKGLFTLAKTNTLIINCSTIDVATARSLDKIATEHQINLLDAPISGGVMGAEAGTLTFMVGGDSEAFNQARPILTAMGKNIFYVGKSGNGSAIKLCNNMLAATSLVAVCEAYNLAAKLGVDAQTFYDVISVSSGQCFSLTHHCPFPGPVPNSPANHDYEAIAAVTIILKDLKLSQTTAQESSVSTPLGSLTTALYEMLNQQGFGHKDLSFIIKMLAGTLSKNP